MLHYITVPNRTTVASDSCCQLAITPRAFGRKSRAKQTIIGICEGKTLHCRLSSNENMKRLPAPPSPKLKFDSGSIDLRWISAPILFPLASTGFPLSNTIGVNNPEEANDNAQNKPAGPAPTMIIFCLVLDSMPWLVFGSSIPSFVVVLIPSFCIASRSILPG